MTGYVLFLVFVAIGYFYFNTQSRRAAARGDRYMQGASLLMMLVFVILFGVGIWKLNVFWRKQASEKHKTGMSLSQDNEVVEEVEMSQSRTPDESVEDY